VIPVEKAEPAAPALTVAEAVTEEYATRPVTRRSGSKVTFLLLSLLLLVCGVGLMKLHDNEAAAKNAEKEAQERAATQAREDERRNKELREQAQQAAALKQEELEAQEQRKKALRDAEAALSGSTAISTGTASSAKPVVVAPVAPTTATNPDFETRKAKIQQLMVLLKAADTAAQKAVADQRHATDLAEKASEQRRLVGDALQKAQIASRAAAAAANKAAEASRKAPRNTELSGEADQRFKEFEATQDAAAKAEQNYQEADKRYEDANAAYRSATTAATAKMTERNKAAEDYNAAVEATNKWIKEQFPK